MTIEETGARGPWRPLSLPTSQQSFVRASGTVFEDVDPTTGELVAEIATSTTDDVNAAVAGASAAFARPDWRNDGPRRCRVLYHYAEALRVHLRPLAELLSREQGKTIDEARSEVLGSADMVEYYAGMARELDGRSLNLGHQVQGVVVREPVGVVAVITPWNWPLTLLVRSLAPALAAGNSCVVKPASLTPAITVEALALLATDPELPDGVLSCVLGPGSVVGGALVGNREVEMVAFTGESGTGVGVMQQAAPDLRKVSLELGGKSPNIVFGDANLDKALAGAVNAAFTTSGQICTAGSRLLVEASIAEQFLDRLVAKVSELRLGDPLDQTTTLGPLVSPSQQQSVNSYIKLAADEGTVLTPLQLPRDPVVTKGCFVAPTVVADLPMSSRVVQEEIFGPVLTVHTFDSEEQALEMAEGTEFGLAAGLWTSDVDRAWRLGRALRAGTIWVNTYHHFYPEAEVGGFKKSGLGRQQGREGILEFTETKHINFDSAPTLW